MELSNVQSWYLYQLICMCYRISSVLLLYNLLQNCWSWDAPCAYHHYYYSCSLTSSQTILITAQSSIKHMEAVQGTFQYQVQLSTNHLPFISLTNSDTETLLDLYFDAIYTFYQFLEQFPKSYSLLPTWSELLPITCNHCELIQTIKSLLQVKF